jgi:hypothetical protein
VHGRHRARRRRASLRHTCWRSISGSTRQYTRHTYGHSQLMNANTFPIAGRRGLHIYFLPHMRPRTQKYSGPEIEACVEISPRQSSNCLPCWLFTDQAVRATILSGFVSKLYGSKSTSVRTVLGKVEDSPSASQHPHVWPFHRQLPRS